VADVKDPSQGFLLNDTLTIRVEITVQRDERFQYDSRKQTGCVGLKNQGATCYMNSLLQFLYHIPYFRKVPPLLGPQLLARVSWELTLSELVIPCPCCRPLAVALLAGCSCFAAGWSGVPAGAADAGVDQSSP
jgi:hypothetical protein